MSAVCCVIGRSWPSDLDALVPPWKVPVGKGMRASAMWMLSGGTYRFPGRRHARRAAGGHDGAGGLRTRNTADECCYSELPCTFGDLRKIASIFGPEGRAGNSRWFLTVWTDMRLKKRGLAAAAVLIAVAGAAMAVTGTGPAGGATTPPGGIWGTPQPVPGLAALVSTTVTISQVNDIQCSTPGNCVAIGDYVP